MTRPISAPPAGTSLAEFVILMAAIMALSALSIDLMLPALPDVRHAYALSDSNQVQWVIASLLFGMAAGSLIHGPLSDRFGRKPVLIGAMLLFLVASMVSALAPSFPVMIASRLACGLFVAANRVVAVSIVRDRFVGDAMARVMSLISMIFMIVPVLAPSFGHLILLIAPWRWTFAALTIMAALLLVWVAVRLPETLHPANRTGAGPRALAAAFRAVVTDRNSMGYTVASGIVMSAIIAYIVSVQQIIYDTFDAADHFPVLFAAMAGWMGLGALLNSRLVHKMGTRVMSQSGLIMFLFISSAHALLSWSGRETLTSFVVFQALCMLCLPFILSNMNAIAMEPFARAAGLASSVQSFLTSALSTMIGATIGALYDGTTLPLAAGFTMCGAAGLLCVIWAERGNMFARQAPVY